ncbi:MAG: FAD-dependent oxidoreductase [Deferrisomatales bacterium]
MDPTRRLVFVGGGHAHLLSLTRADELVRAGAEVVLVAPDRYHYYSGMGPGLLSGRYRPADARFDVEALVTARGGRFLRGRVVRIDPSARRLELEGGAALEYDLASFNTGSRVAAERIPGAAEHAVPVKPIENLEQVRAELLGRPAGAECRLLVIGGGPAGVELAGNAWALARAHGLRLRVTLAEGAGRLLAGLPPRAGRLAAAALAQRGVEVRAGFRLAALDRSVARGAGGEEIGFDLALLASGVVPHPLYAESDLPTGPGGGLLVDDHLRCVGHPELFGGGDGVSLASRPLDRVGVYAVRQAPVLFRNLLASLTGRPLQVFRPQRRYLLILNLGDGTGLLVWGPVVVRARWALAWKHHLDTSFTARFHPSPPLTPEAAMRFTDLFHPVTEQTADAARAWLEEQPPGSYTLLDVRQPEEYEQGHLPGAVLIPVAELADRLGELDPAKPVLAY